MGRNLLSTYLTTSSSTTNDTSNLPCSDFCDPSCGDFEACYTFPAIPDDAVPAPPLLPPLPPTTIVATPSSTSTSTSTHESFHLSPFGIVVIVVLASAFLLISYYAIVIKYCSFLTRFFTRRDLARMQSNQPADPHNHRTAATTNNNNNNHLELVDHPIWLISTVGLHQSIINSITVIPYKKEDGLVDCTDCSVCLSEFQLGEALRLLPTCKHAFHIHCIDTWLRSHTTCPMCRASIVASPNDLCLGHSTRAEFTHMPESDSSDVEVGNTQHGNSSNNNNNSLTLLVGENRGAETGDYIALLLTRSYSMDYQNLGFQLNNSSSRSNPDSLASLSSRPLQSGVTLLKRSYSWSERVFCQNDRNSVLSP